MNKWILGLGALLLAGQVSAADVHIHHPQARASMPGVPNSAAFMRIHNDEAEAIELVAVESDVAKAVELHTHKMIDGKMAMRRVPFIEVPAYDDVELKPGSYHIMFIGLEKPLKEGDTIALTLVFADGDRVPLEVPVKRIQTAMKHDH